MLDLSAEQLCELREILSNRLPEREIRAFGSRVTGHAKPYSDLDLVVMGEQEIADFALSELHADLDESDLPFRVDILLWKDAPRPLRQVIAQTSEPILN